MGVAAAIGWLDMAMREAMLFAAIGLLIGGLDDLAIDCIHFGRTLAARWRGFVPRCLDDLPHAGCRRRLAVLVPAWDESAVIGAMARAALARFDHPDYRLYIGSYPNDPATGAIVAGVALEDARVRPVVVGHPGPTTKADCLNALWHAVARDAAAGWRADAIVLHDAEDVVHPGELRVFDHLLAVYDAVQIPVLPLVDPRSRMVSGHYIDEFAQSHTVSQPVRQALGAGMPFAGTGCAIRIEVLQRIAAARDGDPFDAGSLTEDYELGLSVATAGGRGAFAIVAEQPGGRPVAVRAFFPATLSAAVRQKARWMTGIALAGWDRVGWGAPGRIGDHWMRMRDRRAILAMPVLMTAYLALVLWGIAAVAHAASGAAAPVPTPAMQLLLSVNALLLCWRLFARYHFVRRLYGPAEGWLAVPRLLVANLVALLAARRALWRYCAMLRGRELAWEKTAHHFPDLDAGPAR